jgi:hypothetical protein
MTGMRAFCLVPVMITFSAAPVLAQSTPVDQGTFTITRAGAPYGTEAFLIIRQTGANGADYTLSATRLLDGRTIRSSLKTDSLGGPITYMRQEIGGSPVTLTASGSAGRLTVNVGEGGDRSSKDYLVSTGTLLLEEDLLHQLYFVCLDGRPRTIAYVSPDSRTASTGALTVVGDEEVALGNATRVTGRHFAFGSGAAKREIWIDSNGRLLRISIPGRQIEAVRSEPPR